MLNQVKTAILQVTNQPEHLNKQILVLQSKEILAIIPYKTEKTNMGDAQVLTSVLIVYKE